MEWIAYIVAALFCFVGGLCVVSIVFSIPGGWIMLGLALIIEWADRLYLPPERSQTFDWKLLGICAVLLAIAEAIEFAAGAAGAKRGGASRRGMIGALIGGIVGAIFLTALVPIPIVGSLVGAIIGTFAGAVLGEISGAEPKTMRGSVKPALGATIGRIAGTATKLAITITVWIALSFAAFWT